MRTTPAVRLTRNDPLLAAGLLALQAVLALTLPASAGNGHRPDAVGWTLLVLIAVLQVWRRRAPLLMVLVLAPVASAYHGMGNVHQAVIPATMVALYSLAVAGPPLRTFLVVPALVGLMALVMTATLDGTDTGLHMLSSAGWIFAVGLVGEAVRMHRKYIGAIVERAERAERTREEEAGRRVAEERLRIARDLHDLLAHTITLVGVQTSVAAHVLIADPDKLDREAVAASLEAISDTCRDARAELRATLRVLRSDTADEGQGALGAEGPLGPLPGLPGVPDLVRAAEAAGARVELTVGDGADHAPPAVGAAAYRIVQEALTNAVRHAGGSHVRVALTRSVAALYVSVLDDGPAAGTPRGPARTDGYGIVGMRERARSVGGRLAAEPRADGAGFVVTAMLPLGGWPEEGEDPLEGSPAARPEIPLPDPLPDPIADSLEGATR
ncbi:sensor histidine kinase [Streptomyces sp. SPB162]|uniref:sensor histidine kinase n=1 Tax=Streptomyces sp. SPB162 TaxID=2940560 RepID=UPI0024065FF4|nr:sensor histidine kinase [Streptomyces sp. SPB162]MDF9813147.1 signal transduction histidine kinase [Streptomyces sp. SPB162]